MKYEVREVPNGVLVFADGRCIAGVGRNYYRAWLYPLYTPAGQCVLQEFPFDHPFHNACFVAQHPVRIEGREANFWAVPPKREPNDEIFVHVGRTEGRIEPHLQRRAVLLTLQNVWRDENDAPVLDEIRTYELSASREATVCEVRTRKTAAYGELEFPATKFGGIGVRVDPRLLPVAGAKILGRHDAPGASVAYESDEFGLRLEAPDPTVPWFVRDYGLALYNPTWKQARRLARGEAWEMSLRLVAYTIRA
jgi:hypothetical protein